MSTQRHKEILERFDALLGSDDLSRLDELCTPDMVNHALAPDRPQDSPAPGSSSKRTADTASATRGGTS